MPGQAARFLLALEAGLARLARPRWRAIVLVGLLSLVSRALLLPVLPIPKPAIQDEFSYLLAADTFAHGRLTNPTPAFAGHFETLQVLMHPTYASKYPPFSGLVMALGQRLTGKPWVGIWLAGGILCAAICWALQGWLPPGWALAGSFIALLKIGVVSYWSESYWGGTCTAIGGALLVGSIPRLIRRPNAGRTIPYAAGLAILANTRPYEGLVMAVVCSGYLMFSLWRRGVAVGRFVRGVVLPAAALLAPVAAGMSYYNYRVTGNAWVMPYMAHEKQYAIYSSLLWPAHAASKPVYSNSFLEDFWVNGDSRDKLEAREHPVKTHALDLYRLATFFLGLPLTLCAILFTRAWWRDRAGREALLLLAAFYAGAALDLRLFPHYAAPATVLSYLLGAVVLRSVRRSWPGRPDERIFAPWAVLAAFTAVAASGLLTVNNRYLFGPIDYHIRAEWASVMDRLQQMPGSHLVLVSYGSKHEIYQELVYNRADIEGSRVIWARSLSPEADGELIEHYRDRSIWTLREDSTVLLKSYRPSQDKSTMTGDLKLLKSGLF